MPCSAAQFALRQPLQPPRLDPEPAQESLRLVCPEFAVGDQRQGGALRDRSGKEAVGGRAGQQRQYRSGTGGFAENRYPARIAAECRDVVAHPGQRGDLVAQAQIVVEAVAEVAELETAENPDPIGDIDDDDIAVGGQPRSVVEL